MTELVEKREFIVEQEFFAHVERSIDESGVHPFPGIAIKQDGGIEFAAITDAGLCFQWFKKHLINLDCAEVIVGIDRTTRRRMDSRWKTFGPSSAIRRAIGR